MLIMAGLIIARSVTEHQRSASQAQRGKLLQLLLDGGSDADVLDLRCKGPDVLSQLTTELIALVRGEERAELVATATRLGVPATYRRHLKSGPARARMVAAEMLSYFPDDHCTVALEGALDDRDSGVRLTAALALANSDRAPPAQLLVERLGLGTDENSMMIVTLMSEIARERPDEVRSLVEQDGIPVAVRAAAIEALTSSGDYSLVGLITKLAVAADQDAPELPRYLRVLGAFQHPAALPAITRGLAAPAWRVRAAAAESAGRIGLYQSTQQLERLLDDDEWWVRFRAGEALVRLGETGQQLLASTSRCGTPRARHAARLTLAEHAIAA